MASSNYKLSCALYGHTGDVRSVAVTQEGCIVSGSRDKSAKIWKPNGINTGFSDSLTLVGHTNYVSSVCVLPGNEDHPSIIVTGCHDHVIRAFTFDSPDPLKSFIGHSKTVCCVSVGTEKNVFLSASWDMRAFLWSLDAKSPPFKVFSGHEAAVWCVIQMYGGVVVTGSADKSIKIWNKEGSAKSTLAGHTDCVRALAATSNNEFLSCANDATIRHWNATTGTCLSTFYGHSNYIYSMSVFPEGGINSFVTCGEDHTVKIWQGGECQQTLTLPAQSVWTVAYLHNGDIVTGSSDGVIRIFTVDSSRQADSALQQQFTEEVANTTVAAQQELGGVKISDLPGKEALYEPGRTGGQTKLIRDGTKVFCYSWSSANNEWEKVGDVMGASGGTQANSGKQLYNGKEYDYVFSVDIEDGKPPLKLPYNSDEDPWFAAQKFIHDNNLSQLFLDQVANFIVTNSRKDVPLGSTPGNPEFCDPFTGGNRYIPVGSTSGSGSQNAADPFTGGSRYVPAQTNGLTGSSVSGTASATSLSSRASDNCPIKPFFPQKTYLRFDQANLNVILEKLLEFNQKTRDGVHKVEENYLEGVVKLAGPDATANPLCIQVLKQLFEWPKDIVFPVLDVTRLAVRNAAINSDLCSGEMGDKLIDHLQQFLQPDSLPANKMLSVRTLCNMLTHPEGEALALKHKDFLLSVLMTSDPSLNKQMQVALSTLLLNLAVAFHRTQDSVGRMQAAEAAAFIIPQLSDSEALFRGLVAVGTLVWDADTREDKSELIGIVNSSKELSSLLEKLSGSSSMDKVTQCASQVYALMQV